MEEYSIARTLTQLPTSDIFIAGPRALMSDLAALCARFSSRLQLRLFEDYYFRSIAGYNQLMRSRGFYRTFAQHDFLLIVQTDALVISDQLNVWCAKDYSYVGAPFFVGLQRPRLPLQLLGVGNGGFSLRKVSHFLRVLQTPRYVPNMIFSDEEENGRITQMGQWLKHKALFAYNFPPLFPDINEDIFWGILVPRVFPFFRVPPALEAVAFAFEREPEFMLGLNGGVLPFGCHAWEKYGRAFWQSALLLES